MDGPVTVTAADRHRAQVTTVLATLGEDEAVARATVVGWLSVAAGDTVLDVGSGPGCTVRAIEATGARVICLDVEAAMLTAIRGRVPCVQARAEQLPIADASVDAVLCAGVLHAVEPEDVWAVLAELRRVVRPGGQVLVVNKGIAPWRWATDWYGRMRAMLGDAACDTPPVSLLPSEARHVWVRWILSDTFYVLGFER
jgi:ubiquinone/menaquinone biosynthesis C-methylase UbiE